MKFDDLLTENKLDDIAKEMVQGENPDEFYNLSSTDQKKVMELVKKYKANIPNQSKPQKKLSLDFNNFKSPRISQPTQWQNYIDMVDKKFGLDAYDDATKKLYMQFKSKLNNIKNKKIDPILGY